MATLRCHGGKRETTGKVLKLEWTVESIKHTLFFVHGNQQIHI